MKYLFLLLAFIIVNKCFSQKITKDSIEITYKECYFQDISSKRNRIVDGVTLQLGSIKIKIKNKEGKEIQFSAFSLVDVTNKFRYRLDNVGEIPNNYFFSTSEKDEFNPLFSGDESPLKFRKTKIYSKNGDEIVYQINIPEYDPTVKDYFYDYNLKGITNLEFQTDYGSKKYPKKTITYIGNLKNKYIACSLEFKIAQLYLHSEYYLYYKDEKIASLKF
jgi:hypothetical protein